MHLLLFGVLDGEGSLVSRVEISYILERILAHLDVLGLEPFYGRYSAVSIRVGDPSVFPMGPYDELEVEIDLTRGQRWLYSWEEETAVARGLYIKRSSNLNFWWDLKPTWGLLAGRPGYRFLEALLLLCLGRALWWFYVPMAFFKSLGLYLEKKKYLLRFFSIYGPLRGFGPELVSFRQY